MAEVHRDEEGEDPLGARSDSRHGLPGGEQASDSVFQGRPAGLERLGRAASLLALSLTLSGLTLLALEGAARLVGLGSARLGEPGQDRALWVYDATRGWFHRPSSSGSSFLGGPDLAAVRINSLGLRGAEVSRRKPPGARRLLVLGDSFAFGVGVDEEHLMTTRLAALLDDSAAEPWEVVNLAVSGYSTDQELILFEELGSQLAPDAVLLVACDNDFEGNTQGFAYQQYYKPYFVTGAEGELRRRNLPVPRLTVAERARLWMSRHSSLWSLLRTRQPTHPLAARAIRAFQVRPPLDSGEQAVAVTAALVRALRDRAEAAGARFFLINTGHRGERTPLFHELREHLRRDGTPFLGLEEELQRARRADPHGRWDFGHDTHWNVDSHRRAAEIAHAFLRRAGLPSAE